MNCTVGTVHHGGLGGRGQDLCSSLDPITKSPSDHHNQLLGSRRLVRCGLSTVPWREAAQLGVSRQEEAKLWIAVPSVESCLKEAHVGS